jgi:hypothetical protein
MNEDVNKNEHHYAVVIGINLYYSKLLPDLRGPIKDAGEFVRWLEASGGLKGDNIRVVPASVRSSDKDPLPEPLTPTLLSIHRTLLNVNDEMFAVLAPDANFVPDSRLYIFAAGHGMAKVGETASLFSTEADKGMWGYTLNLKGCLEWYRDFGPFAEVIMFADVCRTRYDDVGIVGLPFDRVPHSGDKRLIIYYATSDGDQAFEDTDAAVPNPRPDDKRGYFSRALTESLSSAVDLKEGYVTSVSLAQSVRKRVRELSVGNVNPPQVCLTEGAIDPPLYFGPRRDGYPVQIRIISQVDRGELQLLDGSLNQIDNFGPNSTGVVWERYLQPGLYELSWKAPVSPGNTGISFKVVDEPVTVDV